MADVVVDASVWVSRASEADVTHARTTAWFEHQSTTRAVLVAPVIMLAEVAGALARITGRAEIGRSVVERLTGLPALRLVPIDAAIGGRAAQIAADLRLRGTDALYVAVAERLTLPLVTWDAEQRDRGRILVETRTPG